MSENVINTDYDIANNELIAKLQQKLGCLNSCNDVKEQQIIKNEIDVIQKELLKVNNGFLLKMTRKYNKTTDFDDAVQYARVELLKAAANFNIDGEYKFSTLAGKYIEHETYRREVQLNSKNRFNLKLNKTLKEFENEGNFNPTFGEIADRMRMKHNDFAIMYLNMNMMSIDDQFNEVKTADESGRTIADSIKDESEDIIQKCLAGDLRDIILKLIKEKLSKRQAEYIYEFFYKNKTQTEIAAKEGLTRERVRQVIHNGLAKLKPYLKMILAEDINNYTL